MTENVERATEARTLCWHLHLKRSLKFSRICSLKLLLWFEWNVVFVAFVVRGRRGVPVSLERARHSARERARERKKGLRVLVRFGLKSLLFSRTTA